MLPLFRNALQVYLFPEAVHIKSAQNIETLIVESQGKNASGSWQAALDIFKTYLAETKTVSAKIRLVLSDRFVRYALMPWPGHMNKKEMTLAAAVYYQSLFGDQIADWSIFTDVTDYGRSLVTCAVESSLINQLNEMCRKNRLRIESCQPFFIDQFNRHCHNLSENALIAVIDADNCVVSTFQNGAWLGIRSIHLQKNDLKEELSVLLKREALLHGLSEPYLVYLLSPKNPDPEWMSAEKMTYYPTELFHEADREISLGTLKSILKKCVPSKFSFFKS